jgi:transcription elongation factor Elf1
MEAHADAPTPDDGGRQEQPPPAEPTPEPTHKVVQVSCGNCKSQFEFPIEKNVLSFGFDCTNCNAHNEVEVPQ